MQIYSISQFNFTSNKSKLPEKYTRENFYSDIDKFLKNKYTKQEYLKKLMNNVDKFDSKSFSYSEKKYMNDMVTKADLAGDFEKISNQDIYNSVKKLFAKNK